MREHKKSGMPFVAALVLAGFAVAAPLHAQQSGRMQVHATVVDVSSSIDVIATLNYRAQQVRSRAEGRQIAAGAPNARSWFMLPADAVEPAPVPARTASFAPIRHAVTVFYY
jgi:hypothetical protein